MNDIKTITFGCRLNFYESEMLKAFFAQKYPGESFVIVNTCAVTHEAERQSKQMVRKAIRENCNAKIIVTGCAAKTSGEYFRGLENIFKIIQNDEKEQYDVHPNIGHSIFEGKIRAFLQIQNGCENFCSFCIVPYTRGKCKSLPIPEILKKVRFLVEGGFKEIVFSGIDITSYGKDFNKDTEFADVLIAVLNEFKELNRIRISSLDPNGVTDKLLDLMSYETRIMPHFHFSIQSGDNHVLKLMRRRHTRDKVINLCNKIRKIRDNIIFGSDFIVGFPGETEEMFMNTLKIIDEADISLCHIFPYSIRNGTLASTFIQLPHSIKQERAKYLREKASDKLTTTLRKFVGKTVTFIVEKEEDGWFLGKTEQFLPIKTKKNTFIGEIVTDTITSNESEFLII